MSKRSIDSELYNKEFFRHLTAPYKLFWGYLITQCDCAGVWIVEDDIAQLRIGKDAKVDLNKALELFNKDKTRVHVFKNGSRWLLVDFIKFQFGILRPTNNLHKGVIHRLTECGLFDKYNQQTGTFEGLINPLPGVAQGLTSPSLGVTEPLLDISIKENNNKDIDIEKKENEIDICDIVVDMYHKLCPSLPKIMPLSKNNAMSQKRKSALPLRVKEIGGIEEVEKLLRMVEESDFLTGRKSIWKANFDWIFLCKSNWIKVAEGNYSNNTEKRNVGRVYIDGEIDNIIKKADF